MCILTKIDQFFPDWEANLSPLPHGLHTVETSNNAILKSLSWVSENTRRGRLCNLDIPGKFFAETLVIYPRSNSELPIFGTEYLRIGDHKFFGAVDFHPLSQEPGYLERYIGRYLGDFPRRQIENSKFYDLSQFFSEKFWIEKSGEDFYPEYLEVVEAYMRQYELMLRNDRSDVDMLKSHIEYDQHMSQNDPAHGILKAYFSESFADFYIQDFLFNLTNHPWPPESSQ